MYGVVNERQRVYYEKEKNAYNEEINAKYVSTAMKKKIVESNLLAQIQSLKDELDRYKKETTRLNNNVRDKDDEISLLLQGDDNYDRIKSNLINLSAFMQNIETTTDFNNQ